jgi:hypothetical protein
MSRASKTRSKRQAIQIPPTPHTLRLARNFASVQSSGYVSQFKLQGRDSGKGSSLCHPCVQADSKVRPSLPMGIPDSFQGSNAEKRVTLTISLRDYEDNLEF